MSDLKKKALIVDDESSIRKLLKVTLESADYKIEEAVDGHDALVKAASFRPEIIILDLGLPDLSGHEVIRKLREWCKAPIVVLTARDSDEDKVIALDNGADDYVTKPFSTTELLARMRVALRHSQSGETNPVIKIGDLEIDFVGITVKVAGELIKLTATEYNILKVLVRFSGKVVTHRMLLNEVWGPNSIEQTNYLRVYMGSLRKKLKINPSVHEYIVTEPGIGYRFLTN